ncbi:restriction endonuclease subunit S [Staphylococcus equorum]|uniref:restriction endonuclease subunit S n=1 Tax=Staphylococcus equorum TaxID=246432 RepID=UPI000E691B66|nr:restriction endonuclease subunit S [Staphylococcus equorum]RIL38383.1 restriction endonuclease subunit S [Staphylococcus equorum]
MTNETKNVPELRFKEFSKEWEYNNLKDITTLLKDGTHGTHKNVENGPWLLSAKNIKNNTINISDEDRKISITDYNKIYKNYTLEREDILLSIVGTIGRVSMVKDPVNIAFQRSVAIIRFSKPLESKFFLYLFGTKEFKKKLYRNQVVSAQPGIYLGDLAKFNIIYPLIIEEQQKIGEFFSKLDQQIELEEQKLSLLEEQKKGYMQKIFSQELRFKDENGNDYPEWEIKKLMQIAKVKTGSKNVQDNIQDGKYKFFDRSVEVKYLNTFDFDETAIIYPGEGSKFLPRYFSGKYSLHQRAYSIYDININNNYLYYYLSLQNNHFLKYAVGSTVKSLRMSGFDKLKVMVPKNSEQEKIGSFFKNLDEFIEKQANKVELLKQRKQSFLQKMFV